MNGQIFRRGIHMASGVSAGLVRTAVVSSVLTCLCVIGCEDICPVNTVQVGDKCVPRPDAGVAGTDGSSTLPPQGVGAEPTMAGSVPVGSTPGGSTPGGSTPGGSTPGGSTPGGSTP